MSMKKALAGAILAGGAILAPFAKGDTKTNHTQKPVTIMAEAVNGMAQKIMKLSGGKAIPLEELERDIRLKKKTMPSWIPITADGKFDEKKAKEQAEMLWAENGRNIQQYADDVKSGVPEEIAFTKFANRLAKGDKEKEKQILALQDVVKETNRRLKGDMKEEKGGLKTYTLAVLFAFGVAFLFAGYKTKEENEFIAEFCNPNAKKGIKDYLKLVAIYGIYGSAISSGVITIDNINKVSPVETFVKLQKTAYDSYKQQDTSKKYTMTDMQTTKQMIKMAQEAKGAVK